MEQGRWNQIGSLLESARSLPPEERTAFLDRSTAGDEQLRKEVTSLLTAYEQATGFFGSFPDNVPVLGNAASASRAKKLSADVNRLVGRSISQYEILEQIGSGGMGVVYKARDVNLRRTVALKFLLNQFARDDVARERFMAEAHEASALDHPNICTIHEIGTTDDDHLFIVMPFYEGETLNERITRGPLPPGEAVAIATQIAHGLKRAHEAGIIHRDIKPANVMITSRGHVKILDFGLAKVSREVSLTKMGTTLGTPAYMSPEQARGEMVDHRSDIWSVGVTLYEMLSGVRPFPGDYELAVLYAILNEQPVPLSERRIVVPQGLAAVVSRCLEKDPQDRYGSMADLLDVLEGIGENRGRSGIALLPSRFRSHGRVLTKTHGLLLLMAVALTLLLWIIMPRSGSESIAGTNDPEAFSLYKQGWENLQEYVDQERVEASIVLFERALQRDSGFALARAGLGQAYWREYQATGDTSWVEHARAQTLKALELDPNVVDAHVTLALMHLGAGNVREALTELRLAQTMDSTDASVWRGLGDVYKSLGDENAAENAYGHAVSLEPDYWIGYNKLGQLHFQFGEYDQAARDFAKIVELDPDNVTGLNNVGGILFALERFDEAKVTFQQLINVQPDAWVHSNLGTIYFYHDSDYERAANQYELALKYDPENYRILANLASAYDEIPGREGNAQETYRLAMVKLEAGKGWETDPLRLSELASIHAALGDTAQALHLADKATSPQPKDVHVMFNAASAYTVVGDNQKAITWLCTALENGYSRGLVDQTPIFEDLVQTREFNVRCG